jgi:glycosyltransferase involved in cell wall biosynthesis
VNDSPKKVLIVSDSPYIQTGFANVGRHIGDRLYRTGNYDVHYQGWFHKREANKNYKIPYPVYTTTTYKTKTWTYAHKMDHGDVCVRADAYGHHTFDKIIETLQPDIVISVGDVWMIQHIADCKYRQTFTWIAYPPIDGSPYPRVIKNEGQMVNVKKTFRNVDILVAFGRYGQQEINRLCDKAVCKNYIHHGVESNVFKPLGAEFKLNAKPQVFNVPPNTFLIGQVSRNQPRKCPNLAMRGIKMFIDRCKPKRPVKYYFHGAINDTTGWDLPDLVKQLGMENHVILNKNLDVGMGSSDEDLNKYYNMMDIHMLPTIGEGWGLPILESMSAGVPNITTRVSAHPEFCECGSVLVDIPDNRMLEEVKTNIRRGYADPEDIANALEKLYNDPDLRDDLGKKGREKAEELDWENICDQWEELISFVPDRPTQTKESIHEVWL